LSLNIYLDECAYAKQLVTLLQAAGQQVVTPADAETSGMDDEVHFRFAAEHGLVLITRDADDFAEIHKECQEHAGILAIHQDNNPDRDMSYADIVRAVGNLENAGFLCREPSTS
jgi:predicted nuclease of predicted toxin-antitoxin system